MKRSLGEAYGKAFEATLLKIVLFDNVTASRVATAVDPDLFTSSDHQEIAATFRRLCSDVAGRVPTYKSVLADFNERIGKLSAKNPSRAAALTTTRSVLVKIKRAEEPSAADVDFVLDSLHKFITHRSTEIAMLECVELMAKGEYDEINRIINEATQSGRLLMDTDVGLEFTDFRSRISAYNEEVRHVKRSPTGVKTLDALMRGGLEPGKLGVVVARPGLGKTMMLVSAGVCALLEGMTVVHFTCEIDARETSIRYDARLIGYPINELRENINRYEKKLMNHARKIKGRCFIKMYGPSAATVNDLRSYLKNLELKKGVRPDVILVDYADLLLPVRKRGQDTDFLEIADTYRALRQLAIDYDARIWTASQVNKEGYDQDVLSLRTMYGSHEKSAIPDVIVALCQSKEEQKKRRLRIVLLKNRQGGQEGAVIDCIAHTATQVVAESPMQRYRSD